MTFFRGVRKAWASFLGAFSPEPQTLEDLGYAVGMVCLCMTCAAAIIAIGVTATYFTLNALLPNIK